MATIEASHKLFSSSTSFSSFSCSRRLMIKSIINVGKTRITTPLHLPYKVSTRGLMEVSTRGLMEVSTRGLMEVSTRGLMEELERSNGYEMEKDSRCWMNTNNICTRESSCDPMVIAKLYTIMEAVADRVEMHENVGKQRDNWNHLLLNSINSITVSGATMCGLASMGVGAPHSALKISSTILFLAATGMLVIMNRIQPSQLAEEQRNASRLFKQLHGQIHRMVSAGNPTSNDVNEAMENVLALDRAFPLPLLGGAMIEKFPSTVNPAVWWPQREKQANKNTNAPGNGNGNGNGWNRKLEDEMREIVGVLKRKDMADYLRLGQIALKLNKIMAISAPLLTFLAAVGSAFVGTNPCAAPVVVGVVGGALATIVNAMEHGGQVGMVFEMYRINAGFFKFMEETIQSNINETDVRRRENGELLQIKVALQLGRTLSDLRIPSSPNNEAVEEFASKLF